MDLERDITAAGSEPGELRVRSMSNIRPTGKNRLLLLCGGICY